MSKSPPYKPGFWLQLKRWLFGEEWAQRKMAQLCKSITLFDSMAGRKGLPFRNKTELWFSADRMRSEADWLNSTIAPRETRLRCPHCGSSKVKSDGDWDNEQQTDGWYECLDCGECFD